MSNNPKFLQLENKYLRGVVADLVKKGLGVDIRQQVHTEIGIITVSLQTCVVSLAAVPSGQVFLSRVVPNQALTVVGKSLARRELPKAS